MSDAIANFHFLRPWWLLALIALPWLWRVLGSAAADAQAWRGAVDAHLLEHLLVHRVAAPARAPRWLAVAIGLLACLALAGPAWERVPQPLFRNSAARVLALELDASMLAQDVKPNRLERARFKIADLLKRNGDAQTALIAYAGDAFVVAPLTDDVNTVANLIDALDPGVMPVAGNDTARAIDQCVKLIRQAGLQQGDIVLIADSVSANAETAAARARAAGMRVSVLGIGSGDGAPVALPQGGFLKDAAGHIVLPKLDAARLQAVAQAGGGRYATFSADGADLASLLLPRVADAPIATTAQSPRFLDRGPWLALLLLPLGALVFRRGWAMLIPLVLFAHAPEANAMSWNDLWQRPDQQAQAQLQAGRAAEAQALARDPDLRGSAAYRAGDYAAAEQAFDRADDAQAQYNRGNALARQGRFDDAIKAYDAALERAPDMDDALANKRAVEDWLKQKKEQKQQNPQSDKSDSNDHQGDAQQQPGEGESSEQKSQQDKNADQDQKSGTGSDQQGDSQHAQENDDRGREGNAAAKAGGDRNDKAAPTAGERDEKAQQRFRREMQQALDKGSEDSKQSKEHEPVRLGAVDGDARDEKQQAVEQWLSRVPDDPGGLLRRKFLLEYQHRREARDGEGDHP